MEGESIAQRRRDLAAVASLPAPIPAVASNAVENEERNDKVLCDKGISDNFSYPVLWRDFWQRLLVGEVAPLAVAVPVL